MTNEDYVTYEAAQALKKAGFDWPCNHYYTKENAADDEVWLTSEDMCNWNMDYVYPFFLKPVCSAPTLAQAHKWLISKGIFVDVSCLGRRNLNPDGTSCTDVVYWYYELRNAITGDELSDNDDDFEDYCTCLSTGIEAALNLMEVIEICSL